MANRSKVDWESCAENACFGVRLSKGERCWAHATHADLNKALDQFAANGILIAQGVPFTTDLLDRILAAAPHDDHSDPILTDVDFRRATFDDAYFGGATFGTVNFRGATFDGTANLGGATFNRTANFRGVTFNRTANLGGATLNGTANFHGATFNRTANFAGATFASTAIFNGATFRGDSHFSGTTIGGDATFSQATFNGDAWFQSVTFQRQASFSEVTFESDAEFGGATFQRAYFGGTTFSGIAHLYRTTVHGTAHFEGATFHSDVQFHGTTFDNETWFDGATFDNDAHFHGTTFESDAHFHDTTFHRNANFNEATFECDVEFSGTTFQRAYFGGTTFSGIAHLRGTNFTTDAHFDGTTFGGPAHFGAATFDGPAHLSRASFDGDAWFDEATFDSDAWFDGATFRRDANFHGTAFDGNAWFNEATFQENAWFRGATFQRHANFHEAAFLRARLLGPMLVRRSLVFDDTAFHQRVLLEVSAAALCCRGALFHAGVQMRVRWAQVVLDDADLASPSILSWEPSFEDLEEGRWAQLLQGLRGADRDDSRPQLVSLRRANVAGLTLTGVNLRSCRFAGAHHLDHLQLHDTEFAPTPPNRLWTIRRTLGEEHHWRALTQYRRTRSTRTDRADDWYGRSQQPPTWLDVEPVPPAQIAALYRSLRKGREDSKDEPGAADFYYGEMEMRRHDPSSPRAERLVLFLYWLLSGYALRASRALAWLLGIVAVAAVLLAAIGLERINPDTDWSFPARLGTSVLVAVEGGMFRDTDQDLTYTGRVVHVVLRVAGPVLLGLTALSVRGRVKR